MLYDRVEILITKLLPAAAINTTATGFPQVKLCHLQTMTTKVSLYVSLGHIIKIVTRVKKITGTCENNNVSIVKGEMI